MISRPSAASGFTLIELVAVLVLLGILSGVAVSRSFSSSAFELQAARGQLISTFRAAQQLAMIQSDDVVFSTAGNQLNITRSGAVLSSLNGLALPVQLNSGFSLSAVSFSFDRLGRTTASSLSLSKELNKTEARTLNTNPSMPAKYRGATLLELIVFLVIVGVALVAFLNLFTQSQNTSVDPLIRVRALEIAQAQLDEILARKFDENTPVGGVPACNASGGASCLGISPESGFDDVGDFHNVTDTSSYSGYTVQVSVVEAGLALGLSSDDQARLIEVNVLTPASESAAGGSSVRLSAYKVNY